MDSVRIFGYRWDYPDMAWVPRRDLDSEHLLPLELSVILPARSAKWFWDDMYPIDAVVVKEKFHASAKPAAARANPIEVLEGAIMIRGEAARYVEKILFNEIDPPVASLSSRSATRGPRKELDDLLIDRDILAGQTKPGRKA
jgi:hypothetical protein